MDVLQYAAAEQKWFTDYELNMFEYETKTTFYSDMSIAEAYGLDAIKDTYSRVVKEWMSNVEFITEFILVVNNKAWEWDARREKGQEVPEGIIDLYSELYYELKDKVYEFYAGNEEATEYIFNITD